MNILSTLLVVASLFNVSSPDGDISVSISKEASKMPTYSISYCGNLLVSEGQLGLQFSDWTFGAAAAMQDARLSSGRETYSLVSGKASKIDEAYNRLIVPFEQDGRRIDIEVKAFDSGVGIRYVFPEQPSWDSYTLTDELTTFPLQDNPKSLVMYLENFVTSHENLYDSVDYDSLTQDALIEMPALFEFPCGVKMSITEASVRDYAGSLLSKCGEILVDRLSPLPGQTNDKVKAVLPHKTPWRTFIIGEKEGDLISANLLTDLCEPCEVADTSWIRPGKTTFTWWNGNVVPDTTFLAGNNFDTNKYYIDFAADNGLDFHSIYGYAEQAWFYDPAMNFGNPDPEADVTKPVRTLDMKRISDYASSKGVGIHLWVNWRPFYEKLEEALTLYEEWGIKGLMVDFMNRDDQEMINIQEEILRKAADHHIFIQFHGACKPSGLNRTFPNEFTREGTRNYEGFKWSEELNADKVIAVPFTRLLAGATDYHLGGFRAVPQKDFKIQYIRPLVLNTRCHMLSLYVVFESYLGMVCDYPEAYLGQKGYEFIRDVPSTWDETVVPAAKTLSYCCVARRSGRDWWMGTINDTHGKTIRFKADFLEEGTVYKAEFWLDSHDAENHPNKLIKRSRKIRKGDSIKLKMAGAGGAAAHFSPVG